MPVFTILHDGEEIPPSGAPPPAPNTYEISAIPAPAPDPDFPLSMQWQSGGVDLGEPNVRVINFIAALDEFLVTRGTGEQSNVITVRKLAVPPAPAPVDPLWLRVVVLLQGNAFADVSSYARSIVSNANCTLVSDSDFPGGLAVDCTGDVSASGTQWQASGGTPELIVGATDWITTECYIKVPPGTFASGSVLVFNDGFGGNGNNNNLSFPVGAPTSRYNLTLYGYTGGVPLFTEGVVAHVAFQAKVGQDAEYFINGVPYTSLGTPVTSISAPDTGITIGVGKYPGSSFPVSFRFAGWRQTISPTKRYNSVTGFIPPSLPLPTTGP